MKFKKFLSTNSLILKLAIYRLNMNELSIEDKFANKNNKKKNNFFSYKNYFQRKLNLKIHRLYNFLIIMFNLDFYKKELKKR